MKRLLTVLTLGFLFPVAGVAQEDAYARDALLKDRRSITFGWPLADSGGRIGVFEIARMRSERISLGWEVAARFHRLDQEEEEGQGDESHIEFGVGPVLKHYLSIQDVIAPYLRVGVRPGVKYMKNSGGTNQSSEEQWGLSLVGSAGLGADWFPMERLSVGGFAGFRLSAEYLDAEGASATRVDFSALTSDLMVSFHF